MHYKEKIQKTKEELILAAEALKEKLQGYFNTDKDVYLGDNNHVINMDKEDVDSIRELEKEIKEKISTLEYIIKYLPNKFDKEVVDARYTISQVNLFLNVLDLDNNIGLGHINKDGLGLIE